MSRHLEEPTAPHLLTRPQAADRLAVSVRTIARLIERGELPAVHVGRAVRVRAADVDALIDGSAQTRSLQTHDPAGRPGRAGAADGGGRRAPE